ncbi:MAG: Fe-coproporphyrin synthase [Clostridia bacterium]|nr:Fe-coproporphyrin synthase [Clostridia bacterium]
MINVTRLLGLGNFGGDALRYSAAVRGAAAGARADSGPVVVWNCTRACNLACKHCYAGANPLPAPDELSRGEGLEFLRSLAAYRVPVLLLSGGEPLVRPDAFDLMKAAVEEGLQVTLSTNGTLIDGSVARTLKNMGISYVGISLDGLEEVHDKLRGKKGAFMSALEGIRHCLRVGQKVGLRLTLTRYNLQQLSDIFYLIEEERIPRVCFYHLVYSGRGAELREADLTTEETRAAVDTIIDYTERLSAKGRPVEVLTVDNHADGPYIYLYLKKRKPEQAAVALELLKLNGGNRSGIAIGEVDWEGNVHPDQFTLNHTLGNVRQRPFGEIWEDTSNPILAGLRDRRPLLKGRCRDCAWLEICNGNCRARAEAVTGDFWESDPACYLTEREIKIKEK